MLKFSDIHKVYRSDKTETAALNGVDLEIAAGEFVSIMGPSGCGKSTLLHLMGLLDRPTSGRTWFMGREVSGLGEKQLARLRKGQIGFIFQNFNLINEMSVEENIAMALLYRDMDRRERKRRVDRAMDRLGLTHRARHPSSQLSGGQRQRVAIARAIVGDQALILADEPTGNLDSAHGREVMTMLRELNEQGATIVMATHSEAHADYSRGTINLFDGRVVAQTPRRAW